MGLEDGSRLVVERALVVFFSCFFHFCSEWRFVGGKGLCLADDTLGAFSTATSSSIIVMRFDR